MGTNRDCCNPIQPKPEEKIPCHKNIENQKFTILVDTKCHDLQLPGLLKAEFLVMSICHPLTTKPAATKGVSSSR